MTKKNQGQMGCREIRDTTIHTIFDSTGHPELEYQTCIGNHYSPASIFWIEAAARYEQGVLPFPGSLTEQPNKVIEIFATISAHKQDKLEKQQKAEQLRNGRRNN